MICVFPDPYPDELLYSACARYSDLMDYPNSTTVTSDFFGEGVIAAVVDLPNRLNHLVATLPPEHLYSVDELIDRHTHYPFYAPFLPHDRALLVRNTMRGSGHNRVAEHIGISAARLKMSTHLRFCPACVEQDKANFGETYWHRIHQIPGVDVCHHHAVFLEESKALWRNARNPSQPFLAKHSVYDTPIKSVNTSDHTHSIQLSIARYAWWLLEWTGGIGSGKSLRFRYYNLLLRQSLAYYSGQIRTTQLIRRFLDYYPSELLIRLGCEIKNPHSNWLLRLLHMHKAGEAHHPIHHILLLIFVGCSPAEVFDSFIEFMPFGEGPWPCLNHASGHYAESRVTSCRISAGEKENKGKAVGTFSCSCGFIYTRTGPDQSEEDRFKWASIRSYGTQWENILKRLWEDTSLTLKQLARMLGVNELTVKRRAISLGLAFPRAAQDSLHSGGEILDRYKIKRTLHQEVQNRRREELLSLLKDNPQASRTELQTLAPHLIDWLRQDDREWLDTTLPPAKKKRPPKASINWEEQDLWLSEAVRNAALQIRSGTIPKRVSLAAIVKLIGYRAWIEKRLDKLPLTSQALDMYLESFEDYSIRRIAWAAESFRKDGVIPSRVMLSN